MIKNYGKTYNSGQNVLIETSQIFDGGGKTLDKIIYPIGSVYISINSTDPHELFGGIWVQIKDAFLLACGDVYSNGSTGGEATHKLTINEMPSHNHMVDYDQVWDGGGGTRALGTTDNGGSWASGTWVHNTGGSQAHNNMPPYLAVYMWYRTA